MEGKRVYLEDWSHHLLQVGEYTKQPDGAFYARCPNGLMANLGGHNIIEHQDGTITVSPSILVTNGSGGLRWHGYLEKGVWRSC